MFENEFIKTVIIKNIYFIVSPFVLIYVNLWNILNKTVLTNKIFVFFLIIYTRYFFKIDIKLTVKEKRQLFTFISEFNFSSTLNDPPSTFSR